MILKNEYCRLLAKYDDITEEEWYRARRYTIGGSDAAAIMGLSKYDSPLTIYLKKKGLMKEQEENDYTYNGNEMEDYLRDRFSREMQKAGIDIFAVKSDGILESVKYPNLTANLDGFVQQWHKIIGVLEIKCYSEYLRHEWHDADKNPIVPDHVNAQIQHYMFVTGLEESWVAAYIHPRLEIRHVKRDEEFIERMIEAELDFYNSLDKNEMPAPCGMDCDTKALKELYKTHVDVMTDRPGMSLLYNEYAEIVEQIGKLEDRKNEIKNKFRDIIGNEKGFTVGDKGRVFISEFERNYFVLGDFKRDHPDLWKEYSGKRKQERLYVK